MLPRKLFLKAAFPGDDGSVGGAGCRSVSEIDSGPRIGRNGAGSIKASVRVLPPSSRGAVSAGRNCSSVKRRNASTAGKADRQWCIMGGGGFMCPAAHVPDPSENINVVNCVAAGCSSQNVVRGLHHKFGKSTHEGSALNFPGVTGGSAGNQPSSSSLASMAVARIKARTSEGLKRLTSRARISNRAGASESKTTGSLSGKAKSPAAKSQALRTPRLEPTRQGLNRKLKTRRSPKRNKVPVTTRRRIPMSLASTFDEAKENVSRAINSLSCKFRLGARGVRPSSYDPLMSANEEGGDSTPVKLYSPFTFEESTPPSQRRSARTRRSITISRAIINTPTEKFRRDLDDMSRALEEMASLGEHILGRTQPN